MNGLSDRAMLVNLSMSVWNAVREDTKCAADIAAKYGSDARMGKFRRFLIDPAALKPILTLKGEIRNRHYDLTLPWGDDSARIITTAGYLKYRDEMRAFQDQFEPMAREFWYAYPDLVQDARALLNGLWNASEYPNVDAIRAKFSMRVKVRPVPESDDFRCALSSSEVSSIRQQIEADAQACTQLAMAETATRIKDVIGHMSARLKAYDIDSKGRVSNPFRDSMVSNVRDLVDVLPGLNLTGDAALNRLIAQMRTELTQYSAEVLRDDSIVRAKVADSADDILAKLSSYGL